jgi:acetyl esterase/lipase
MIEVSLLNESPTPVEVDDVDTLEQSGTPAVDATLSISGAAADAKVVGDDFKQTLKQRSNPSPFTSLAALTDPGFFYINKETSKDLTDCPVYDRSCRLLNIRTRFATGTLQILADCNSDTLFFRVTTGAQYPSTTWLDWKELKTASGLPDVFPMYNTPRDMVHEEQDILNYGHFSQTHTEYGLGKSHDGMLDIGGAKSVTITWDNTGLTAEDENYGMCVFWYNADFEYLAMTPWQHASPCTLTPLDVPPSEPSTSPLRGMPTGARYAVVYVLKPEGVANGELISIVSDGDGIKQVKMPPSIPRSDGFWEVCYEVEPGVANSGQIMLPPNYNPIGKPVPVIVFVHGSGGYFKFNAEMNYSYADYWAYLRDCGYAIVDCWGWTTKYEYLANIHDMANPYTVPISVKAYHAMIDFFLRNYNLDGSNMFVMCKSLGGHMAEMLLSSGRFRAGALLAPALAYLGRGDSETQSHSFGYDQYSRTIIATELGLTTDPDHSDASVDRYVGGTFTEANGRLFWKHNLDKLSGSMPNWKGLVGNSAAEKLEEDLSRKDNYVFDYSTGTYDRSTAYTPYPTDDLCMTGYPPTTIWAAMDDEAINIPTVQAVVRNIRNAGQYAKFRVMPDNTGGHHAVDSDANARKNLTDITTVCGITYEAGTVPLAYVEAEQFLTKHRV